MSEALRILGTVVGAYLIGSIPFAVIVVRLFWKQDIRDFGSGNTGATNVLRVFGTAPGLSVYALDALKGAAGVGLALQLAPESWGVTGRDWFVVLGAMAAIAGHTLSPFLGFKGGKGVATASGAVIVAAPRVVAVMVVLFLIVVAISKYVSLGSIVIAVMFPVVCLIAYPGRYALAVFALLAGVFVIWKHRSNLGRIKRGEEHRISFKRRMWDEHRSASKTEGREER
ncbi:MAG: glycerol-3-phosphate 1-O-acyltransferase PlsY [Coriobacteriia bacterium]|nr:glycerol-3-phosphate 1-O-acyltransferase PlsY [Coriobacteriia bacterium]